MEETMKGVSKFVRRISREISLEDQIDKETPYNA
jgi:hypothetical protein